MGAFFVYILKSSLCLAVFYLFYRLLLSKETFHRCNRIALLSIILLSYILPLATITTSQHTVVSTAVTTVEAAGLGAANAVIPMQDTIAAIRPTVFKILDFISFDLLT